MLVDKQTEAVSIFPKEALKVAPVSDSPDWESVSY